MRRDEHKRFLKRLEHERPEPSDDLVSKVSNMFESSPATRATRSRSALAFAFIFTLLLVVGLSLTGGISYAGNAVKNGTSAVTVLVKLSSKSSSSSVQAANSPNGKNHYPGGCANPYHPCDPDHGGSGDHQYHNKVLICHKPGPHEHTILVPPSAVHAHLAHGDTLGPCPSGN